MKAVVQIDRVHGMHNKDKHQNVYQDSLALQYFNPPWHAVDVIQVLRTQIMSYIQDKQHVFYACHHDISVILQNINNAEYL